MSLFMMLSGIFASSVLKDLLEFVWDKLKQLVIPAFLWTSVAVVVLFVWERIGLICMVYGFLFGIIGL